jgi:hypothetical protein
MAKESVDKESEAEESIVSFSVEDLLEIYSETIHSMRLL